MFVRNSYSPIRKYGWKNDDDTRAVLFDGVDEGLTTGGITLVPDVGAFTYACWVRVVDTVGSTQAILCRDTTSSTKRSVVWIYRGI